MTAIPHSNKARCTTSGLAGAPLGVVSANQYVIAGQSDLFTRVGFPSSSCSENVLGTGLGSLSSSSSFLLLCGYRTKVECCVRDS